MLTTNTLFEILIIEENKIICLDLITQLKNEQYKVACCTDLGVLSRNFKQLNLDLIITSRQMYRKLKEDKNIYIFDKINDAALSSYRNSDLLILDENLKIIKSFSKPFNSVEVQLFINSYLGI